jgi:hypothetical protein
VPPLWKTYPGGAATGCSFPSGLGLLQQAIEFAHTVIDPIPAEQVRNPRVFAAEKPAPVDATESEAFLAWTGRDLAWHASE